MAVDAAQELEAMKKALASLEPLDKQARARAMSWLGEALSVAGSAPAAPAPVTPARQDPPPSGSTPRQFMTAKKPINDVERITCLAYFLTHERGTPHFKTKDLTELNTEAAGRTFGNASQAGQNAMNQNDYLARAGKGSRQITARGEALVEALPDREAVTKALSEHPKARRRSKKAATKDTKS